MLYDTICSILAKTRNVDHRFLKESKTNKKAVVAITSNRGLAGGYNSNVVKAILAADLPKEDTFVYAIGKKGIEGLRRKGYTIHQDLSEVINAPLFGDAMELTKQLLTQYEAGEIGEIYLAYTNFKNTVTQEAKVIKLLPIDPEDFDTTSVADDKLLMNFEPDDETVLDRVIPKYMSNIIFGAFLEAVASENGARMQAMDSATNNAADMIANLELSYNRARQGAITQELTEIIAGADAVG